MSLARSSRRYFDPRFEATIITVAPGEHEITSAKDEIVATVLGSCVSVCMRDPQVGVGGLNHFLLPKNNGGSDASAGERYGDTAMEVLINGLLKRGARRNQLEAKVFSKDVGGTRSRRIHYQPSTGRAWVQHVQQAARDPEQEQEIAYLNRLKTQPVAGEVEVW